MVALHQDRGILREVASVWTNLAEVIMRRGVDIEICLPLRGSF